MYLADSRASIFREGNFDIAAAFLFEAVYQNKKLNNQIKADKRRVIKMKAQISKLKTSGSLFLLNLFQFAKEHNISSRATALFLMTAILTPILLLAPPQIVSAKSSHASTQDIRVSAPLKPNLFSSNQNIIDILPSFTAIGSVISNGYSSIAAFIAGPGTPEGLGAATPPPTLSERFVNFVASPFISLNGNNPAASKTIAKKNISINTPTEESSLPEENEASESTSTTLLPPPCSRKSFDFDGDCKADISRWQANSFQYKIYNSSSSTYTTLNLGSTSSKIAPADFDGDGKFDMTVFSAGAWTVRKSSTGTNWSMSWGTTGDVPAPADYDGDGTADFGIYRPSTNIFWVLTSSSNYVSYTQTSLGTSGDIVVPGDYNGNGSADYAVFRPSNGHWYYKTSTSGSVTDIAWGVSSDIPAPGDFDSDGATDITVFRPSTGTWYVLKSSGGWPNAIQTNWGNNGDQPVPADYDGDGTTDIAVYRPTTGVWWIINSSASPSYTTFALGTSSDTAVPSAFLKQAGAELYPNQLNPARLAPINQTGGTNLYSRNFSWGTGLVSLPGRAGMNLGIGMSYNSLVWTKIGSVMAFDVDNSNITPGFNFGFPRIEPAYINSQTSTLSYLMVSPSGGRTEFRQTRASDVYETADSSYAQVKVNNPGTANSPTPIEDITLTVTSTNGTRMEYAWIGGAYRCTQIKDRNGNYITISNNGDGRLTSVTDTLGRTITVNYGSNDRVSSITQNWLTNNGGPNSTTTTHTWASFTYTTQNISTSFDGSLAVFGPANSTSITVLDKVTYADGSFTKFNYNSYGQVFKVTNVSSESSSHILNYVKTDLESPPTNPPPTDCPRFGETRNWVEDFNYNQNNVEQETVVTNTFAVNQSYSVGGVSGTATKIEVSMANDPYNHISKTFVGSSGWMEGLPIATEDCVSTNCTGTDRKRWTWTSWIQDDTSKNYIVNPRQIESKVGDTTNTKRTTTEYYTQPRTTSVANYGLIKKVEVYGPDQSTVWKKIENEYNLDTDYTSRRIIGLPSKTKISGLNQSSSQLDLVSEVTYQYDESDFSDSGLSQNISPIQHDNTNYTSSFVSGRGNLTSTTRLEVPNSTNPITSSVKYNTAGAAVSQVSPWTSSTTREVKISYADKFNDGGNSRNTYAYPTKITDPAGYYSEVKYRFDIGANVWAKSPTPQGSSAAPNSQGKETTRNYDSVGRIEKETIVNTGAYTRYEYPSATYSKVYSTVIDTNNNGADSNDEVLSENITDGAGRIRYSRTPMTFNTSGNPTAWSATITQYDILGRVKNVSVPTEVDSDWYPTGDDYTRGWIWNTQEYDWKGRTTRIIPSDSNGADGKDQLFSYDGCGCAGGQVTTIQSELVPRDDQPNTNARRTQKIHADILGRTEKTEVMKWDGITPYTTTVQTFNGRDQVTQITQYDNDTTTTPTPHQDVIMTYDGQGRMSSRLYPIEDSSTNWTYNPDNSISTITDPRGVITDFTYNSRGLVSQIGYNVPTSLSSTVPDPGDITFDYDSAGNRKQMIDGSGTTDYEYDELSRLKKETKSFSNITSRTFGINYAYHLGGALKTIKDPFDDEIYYANDKTGRITEVTGSSYASVASYADDIKYRAFGQIKQLDYTLPNNETPQLKLEYDNRLRVNHSEVSYSALSGGYAMKADFSYFADGRVQAKNDLLNDQWDRTMKYDFAGRLNFAQFGMGPGAFSSGMKRVYEETITYDTFSQMTARSGTHWDNDIYFSESYVNGRVQASDATFDAAGNLTHQGSTYIYQTFTFDAAGRKTGYFDSNIGRLGNLLNYVRENLNQQVFDGDGRPVIEKRGTRGYQSSSPPSGSLTAAVKQYQVWSTVLGKNLTTIKDDGTKLMTKVYAGGTAIAEQRHLIDENNNHNYWIEWKTADPVTGTVGTFNNGLFYQEETEPLGQKILGADPAEPPEPITLEQRLLSADEPEWYCAAAEHRTSNFLEMPTACAIKHLSDPDYIVPGSGDLKPWFNLSFAPTSTSNIARRPIYYDNSLINWDEIYDGYKEVSLPGDDGLKIIGISGDQLKLLTKWLNNFSENTDCAKAFEAAGVETIASQVLNGLTIVGEAVATNSKRDGEWSPDDKMGNELRKEYADHPKAMDLTYTGPLSNGRRYMSITDYGFSGLGDDFRIVLIHALIHSGGMDGKGIHFTGRYINNNKENVSYTVNGITFTVGGTGGPVYEPSTRGDLEWMGEKYNNIIKACVPDKEPSPGWARGQPL